MCGAIPPLPQNVFVALYLVKHWGKLIYFKWVLDEVKTVPVFN